MKTGHIYAQVLNFNDSSAASNTKKKKITNILYLVNNNETTGREFLQYSTFKYEIIFDFYREVLLLFL